MFRELVYLTKFIPHTKFYTLNKFRHLIKEPILDLGCQKGDTFWYAKISGDITGIDLFAPYIEVARERNIYKELIQMDILDIDDGTLDLKRFKTVTILNVLEHLTREETEKLLKILENVGETLIISVPYGFSHQDETDGNVLEIHKSHYFPDFFVERGFEVHCHEQLTISQGLNMSSKEIFAVRRNPY